MSKPLAFKVVDTLLVLEKISQIIDWWSEMQCNRNSEWGRNVLRSL